MSRRPRRQPAVQHHQHRGGSTTAGAASRSELEVVRIKLLGGFHVWVGPRILQEDRWHLRKARSLIKLLALSAGHRLHREQVMETLWPHLQKRAASNNLRRTLHATRSALDPAESARYVASEEGWLVLCPGGPLWVDVEAFEDAAATAHREREPAAYRVALDLYPGDLLPADRYEEWTEERRRELRRLNLDLLAELASIHEHRGEHGPAIEALARLTTEEPAREEAHVGLMRLYALSGRQFEALKQYEVLKEALVRELGTEPNASSRALRKEIASGTLSPPAGGTGPEDHEAAVSDLGKHNLPVPRTSFVGRHEEMLEVKRDLSMTRLLTLTGAGGSGKTRLALEVCRDLVGVYPDGVWLVELAPLSEGALVVKAVAEATGVREQPGRPITDTLVGSMRDKVQLLVLDNCEHLIDATARLVDTLLDACPNLRVLATGRETLGVAGELIWQVSSLSVPDERTSTVEGIEGYESARLFTARASYRSRDFSVTPENAQSVATICRRLDGIPLAIELAAARVGSLSVEQIAQRLDDSLMLLTGGGRTAVARHHTMRGALDWSHGLLSADEKKLFGRLSVFAGGWTLEAAETVGAGEGVEEAEILDLLSGLVQKSLVIAKEGNEGGVRYRLLEPVRLYARGKLEESGDAERVRERHAEYFLVLAERADPELAGPGRTVWLKQLATEYDNIRAALGWCLDDEEGVKTGERSAMGLRLSAALGRFWDVHSPSEGRRWLERGLSRGAACPAPVRARALVEAGFIATYQADPRAIAMLEEALVLSKESGDKPLQAFSLSYLVRAVTYAGDRARLNILREEAEMMLLEPLDRRTTAHLLISLGLSADPRSDHQQVIKRCGEALVLFRELGDLRDCAICLNAMGIAATLRKDIGRAKEYFEDDLRILRQLEDKTGIVYGLIGMGGVAAHRGQDARAARLFGAADALRETIGLRLTPLATTRYNYEVFLATARGGLGETGFDTAFSEGRNMSSEEAIEYALSEEDTSPRAIIEPRALPPDSLTPREKEVAILVKQGLTNRRIATELVLSEHTVRQHVKNILKKLGIHSRERVASRLRDR